MTNVNLMFFQITKTIYCILKCFIFFPSKHLQTVDESNSTGSWFPSPSSHSDKFGTCCLSLNQNFLSWCSYLLSVYALFLCAMYSYMLLLNETYSRRIDSLINAVWTLIDNIGIVSCLKFPLCTLFHVIFIDLGHW